MSLALGVLLLRAGTEPEAGPEAEPEAPELEPGRMQRRSRIWMPVCTSSPVSGLKAKSFVVLSDSGAPWFPRIKTPTLPVGRSDPGRGLALALPWSDALSAAVLEEPLPEPLSECAALWSSGTTVRQSGQ